MRQQVRTYNLKICYRKKQTDFRFSCVFPVTDNDFRQHCQSSLRIHSATALWTYSYFDNVMTKFIMNNKTDAWKTGVDVLIIHHRLSFILSLLKFLMIVDDSLSCLTTRMIIHDSFWSAVFPENQRARLKWPPNGPREAQLQKFVFIFKMIIMTKKILKTKITVTRYLPKRESTRKN